jgi:hypothetical protein
LGAVVPTLHARRTEKAERVTAGRFDGCCVTRHRQATFFNISRRDQKNGLGVERGELTAYSLTGRTVSCGSEDGKMFVKHSPLLVRMRVID